MFTSENGKKNGWIDAIRLYKCADMILCFDYQCKRDHK